VQGLSSQNPLSDLVAFQPSRPHVLTGKRSCGAASAGKELGIYVASHHPLGFPTILEFAGISISRTNEQSADEKGPRRSLDQPISAWFLGLVPRLLRRTALSGARR
jgi:hypothetical protein